MPDNSIGALWTKQGKSGAFYSGYIEIEGKRIEIVAFNNNNATNPKAPSIRILKGQPRTNSTQSNGGDINVEDIPF